MSHFFKSLVQIHVYLSCLDPARNDSRHESERAEESEDFKDVSSPRSPTRLSNFFLESLQISGKFL